MIAGVVMAGVLAATWSFSAERETWARKPEAWEWHPSRLYVSPGPNASFEVALGTISERASADKSNRWSKQLIEYEKEDKKQ
jgi:hypothetical protein